MSSVAIIESQNLLNDPKLVNDFAKFLHKSKKIPINQISKYMTNYFRGNPSNDFIRKHLDDKYKDQKQSSNAKQGKISKLKQKASNLKKHLEETTNEISIAEVLYESIQLK